MKESNMSRSFVESSEIFFVAMSEVLVVGSD